jgi:hypothetical protein
VAICAAIVLAAVGIAGPAVAHQGNQVAPNATAFDFDNGNAASQVIFPQANTVVRQIVDPGDATIILRLATLVEVAWFDAIAPYQPKAVGIYSNLGRRPASEGVTNRNKNIAIMYASYRVLSNLLPERVADWRAMMTSVGLDPDDNSTNRVSPVGLGNLAAQSVIANREHDGMNQLGDEGGRKYNLQPYRDYTGYQPVNSPLELKDPSRWQPNVITTNNGIFRAQKAVTPQLALTKAFTYTDPAQFVVAPPVNSDFQHNRDGYKQQTDEVLAASAGLTEQQKLTAELFNDKFASLGVSTGEAAQGAGLDLNQFVNLHVTVNIATFDTAIAVWHWKYTYDAVRPFSSIRFLYGDKKITAWGGPGKGTVNDITGNEWRSYLNTADHPEYPSGSATFCSAHAEAARRFLGTDNVQLAFPFPAGSSKIEPGLVPAADSVLTFSNWTDFAHNCGFSRFWAGVHFKSAVVNGLAYGGQFGDRAYDFVQQHINGSA